ncbi:MAG: signal recognition particle-docking protein FtsY [Magnetococcus sp. DMHC-6]
MSLFERFKTGLQKTREGFTKKLDFILSGGKVDDKLLEELESLLITGDFGVETTELLLEETKKRMKAQFKVDATEFRALLQEVVLERMIARQTPWIEAKVAPHVILVVGVNGVGKTTTIGKLAYLLQNKKKKVLLAAGDTFRAAAVSQLQVWGNRAGCRVIAQDQNADSASVIFDAHTAARAREMDYLIADTAGRLHTKVNLMEELKKIKRVLQRQDLHAPHDTLLVLDATTGQNALSQVQKFHQEIGLTGLIVTKLDGTAKGGVVVGLSEQLNLPIRFIGVGEKIDDLKTFQANDFVAALFSH